jgi:hypothetical protein
MIIHKYSALFTSGFEMYKHALVCSILSMKLSLLAVMN